ncbi:MAG: hypothetical protein U0105_23005 [Candidatus Obscuribacterales bacterium]|jgi:predicted transglutaminase-like cysteine proteinase
MPSGTRFNLCVVAIFAALLSVGIAVAWPQAVVAEKKLQSSPPDFRFYAQQKVGTSELRNGAGDSRLLSESAQISQKLNALVSPAVQLSTDAEVAGERDRWAKAWKPIGLLEQAGKCTAFTTVDNYTPAARQVTVTFTYLPDGSIVNPSVGDSTIRVTDAQRESARSEAIKKTLLAQFKSCPKLLAIPSLPPAGVKARYELWIKEPVAK